MDNKITNLCCVPFKALKLQQYCIFHQHSATVITGTFLLIYYVHLLHRATPKTNDESQKAACTQKRCLHSVALYLGSVCGAIHHIRAVTAETQLYKHASSLYPLLQFCFSLRFTASVPRAHLPSFSNFHTPCSVSLFPPSVNQMSSKQKQEFFNIQLFFFIIQSDFKRKQREAKRKSHTL